MSIDEVFAINFSEEEKKYFQEELAKTLEIQEELFEQEIKDQALTERDLNRIYTI